MLGADREFLIKSVPNLSQSAEGRRQMVNLHVSILQRQAEVAKMVRQWQQRHGRIDAVNPATGKNFQDNLNAWMDTNPLFTQ